MGWGAALLVLPLKELPHEGTNAGGSPEQALHSCCRVRSRSQPQQLRPVEVACSSAGGARARGKGSAAKRRRHRHAAMTCAKRYE